MLTKSIFWQKEVLVKVFGTSKKKIGIISPELHWYYDLNANVAQTIVSGFLIR